MDEIPGSLAPGARGPAVANLQDALRQCLESGGLLAVDAAI